MSAIITDQIRILNAKNFVAGFNTTANSYYSFVGLPNPTAIDSDWDTTPPAPTDNFNDENKTWETVIALKKITSDDAKQVVKKKAIEFGKKKLKDIIAGGIKKAVISGVKGQMK